MPTGETDIGGLMGRSGTRGEAAGAGRERAARLTPAEFAERLSGCSRSLWSIAAGVLADRSSAEDVVQDAAVIGLQKLADFDPSTSFLAWMGQIVRNVARNHARRRQRSRTWSTDPVVIDASRTAEVEARPAPVVGRAGLSPDQESFDDRVIAALNALAETARVCLLLRTVNDLSYREIALVLGVPEGTAMSHVHRARLAMREELGAPGTARGHGRNA